MNNLIALFVIVLLWSWSNPPIAADHPIDVIQVTEKIYMLHSSGLNGNVAVSVGADGVLLVDDQSPAQSAGMTKALQDLSKGRLKFILNTHHHFDHTGTNAYFGQFAPIIAHHNTRKRLANNSYPPVITYADSLSLHFNGEAIQVRHLPNGHTDNDSIVFFTHSNVLATGDLFFSDGYPSFYPQQGGNIEQYTRNVADILALIDNDTKLIPGHGPLADRTTMTAFEEMLSGTIALVRRRIEDGKTLEQVLALGMPKEYQHWETPWTSNAKWLEQLYKDMQP